MGATLIGALVACRQSHSEHRREEAHLAYTGVGEHGFRVGLCNAHGDAVERSAKAHDGQQFSPARKRHAEGQKSNEPDDTGLDGGTTENGGGRNRRCRVAQRHPEVHRQESDFHSETGYQ